MRGDLEMLEGVAHDPCVEIGAHTVSHPHLAGLSPEEVLHEMTECRARLIERLGVPVRHFAFPYGRAVDCGKRDFEIARRAGYASASTTRKGLIRGGRDPFGLPRNTLNGSHRHLAFAKAHLSASAGLPRESSVVSERPLRVFSIAHPAIKCDSGRLRYDPLAARTDLDLHLLVPSRWHQFGRVMTAETSASSKIQLEIAPIALPKAGPLSWYLHFYPGLRRLLRRLDPDVVHLWEEPWSVVALQACLLKGRAAPGPRGGPEHRQASSAPV